MALQHMTFHTCWLRKINHSLNDTFVEIAIQDVLQGKQLYMDFERLQCPPLIKFNKNIMGQRNTCISMIHIFENPGTRGVLQILISFQYEQELQKQHQSKFLRKQGVKTTTKKSDKEKSVTFGSVGKQKCQQLQKINRQNIQDEAR